MNLLIVEMRMRLRAPGLDLRIPQSVVAVEEKEKEG
jgi:hypothetical protein